MEVVRPVARDFRMYCEYLYFHTDLILFVRLPHQNYPDLLFGYVLS